MSKQIDAVRQLDMPSIYLRVPEQTFAAVKVAAKDERMSVNQWLRRMIDAELGVQPFASERRWSYPYTTGDEP